MLNVSNLSYQYKKNQKVIDGFSFQLKEGEHLCVMGESGCGKSTLLKLIYGLLDAKEGSISWKNIDVIGPKDQLVPGFEHFKYVAQDFDLMPYTSVSENIKKHLSRFYPEEAEERTEELLSVIEMEAFATKKVKTLSGGQQQRVAIARALAKEPQLLLLDEPFSQIDNFRKNNLRRKLFNYLKKQNIACIVATHDKNDALSFADELLIIRNHKILRLDSSSIIYKNPKEKYVAALFDDVNEIIFNGEKQLLYPHQLKVVENSNFSALVKRAYFKGFFWLIEAYVEDQVIFFNHPHELKKGQKVCLSLT